MRSLYKDQSAITIAETLFVEMRTLAPSLVFAALITDDGFEVTRVPHGGLESGRLASMTSSVQSLSDAVARELVSGTSDYVVIATNPGHLLQLRVPGQTVILAALFDDKETLGKALAISRRGVEQLESQLAAMPLPL